MYVDDLLFVIYMLLCISSYSWEILTLTCNKIKVPRVDKYADDLLFVIYVHSNRLYFNLLECEEWK